ncbi:cytospin-B isoform X1 [Pipistrellus kuhlii]|uniref:Sperm antigen with calponin homology and coiled-coil domains 1 n=2 Tax=Pipistrellus kuhlii TaxID=59472 RepID=A0A7J7S6H0_PIPKU|nr:cytospin-B isoform X1 [Pipistrellus kuhlii]KAF6284026.1 sperm antigen with calponin homology and coiled-coil domains 1 [Pipistrellus kuhlii]
MRSAAKPWNAVAKVGSHGSDRARPLATAASGMKSSKSSTSLACESQLSKLKRASSEDMLNKPGSTAASGVVRLKKTSTAGTLSELTESRLRSHPGSVTTTKRTGIPAPRELSATISRERTVPRGPSNPKKSVSSPTSSSAPTPTKHQRPTSARPKPENEGGEKAVLEAHVRELLAEAKAKDGEISRLRSELRKCREKRTPNTGGSDALDPKVDGASVSPGDSEPLIQALEEKNKNFQKELADLEEENRALKEKLSYFEHSPSSEGASSHTGDSSCPTSITQESSLGSPPGNPLSGEVDECKKHAPQSVLRTSGSSSSDVTKASLSPDASDFEHITADTPSRPLSSTGSAFKSSRCSTTGSSPNNASQLSLASLTEKIQKMEENHHSTAEELQATLQELSDQQQMVQELTAENEKLVDEKTILETSFHQHRERAEQLSHENEKLINLLQERVKKEEPSTQEGKVLELEQKCTEILEQGRFEREKLLNIQQQLTCSLRKAEEENQGALEMIKHLKEENERLNGFLEREQQNSSVMAQTLEECTVTLEGLKLENGSLKAHLENEKQKAMEASSVGQTAEGCEIQEMLKAARAEKDQLELSCTELKQELLKAHGDLKHVSSLLAKVEKDYSYLKEICDHQAEQLSRTSLKLQEKASESDAEIKDMKETIFELEDQVEQHRAVKLHNNQLISELESSVMKLEEQKADLERQLKTLTKQLKEETEEWRRFQADLQTAVVVANDIKCEAQQELRTVKRRLLEEEEKNARLQKELGDMQGHGRPVRAEPEPEATAPGCWPGVFVSRAPAAPLEPATTVKSLIKSFDLGHPGGAGQNVSAHKPPRSPLSGIPVRTAPAAAVSPMQRHSTYSGIHPASKGVAQRLDLPDLPLSGLLKGRADTLKPDPYLRKSPSLESLSRPPALGFGSTRLLSTSTGGLRPPSKLSVGRRDPLAALAREYGGSKRNALLRWCQRKTEGYANIDITNFSSSWSDGLAFCALLHTYLPAHIPYQELSSQEKKRNLLLAFEAAESVGIKPSLELSEMLHTDRPDWQSVMQYVAQIYKYFET